MTSIKSITATALCLVAAGLAETLQLDARRAAELALANNRQLALAQAKLEEAAYGRNAAFGSFLPQVSATGTYTRLARANEFTMFSAHDSIMTVPVFDPQGNYIGNTGVPVRVPVGVDTFRLPLGSVNNYSAGLTAQQTLFTWGKLINAYRIAGLTLDMQQEAARQARAQVRLDAISGFYQALLAEKTLEVMRASYQQLAGHVAQVQSLYENGLASRLDLMKATLGLQQLEAQVSQMENTASLALSALRNTLGLEPDMPVSLVEDLQPDSMTVVLDSAQTSALANRPELRQLRDAVRIADLGVRIARTANLPTAFAQFNYSYRNPVGFSAEWGSDWNATAGLSWPLFTGLSNHNKLRQAQARLRQARFGLAMAEDGIRLEVQAAVSALHQEAKNTAYQSANVRLAEDALALAETRYQNGLLTNLEYLDTQVALTQARVARLNALANYQIAKARLAKATGAE
ncbi:MAG: TolC family protein [candidate division WOR-3 bacterium]